MRISFFKTAPGLALLLVVMLASSQSFAEDGIEVRAARVCAGIGKMEQTSQGVLTIDNLDLRANTNGTVTIRRDGVDLGKIEKGSFQEFKSCLLEVMKILAKLSEINNESSASSFAKVKKNRLLDLVQTRIFTGSRIGDLFDGGGLTGAPASVADLQGWLGRGVYDGGKKFVQYLHPLMKDPEIVMVLFARSYDGVFSAIYLRRTVRDRRAQQFTIKEIIDGMIASFDTPLQYATKQDERTSKFDPNKAVAPPLDGYKEWYDAIPLSRYITRFTWSLSRRYDDCLVRYVNRLRTAECVESIEKCKIESQGHYYQSIELVEEAWIALGA
jgi:hypothetical protein